MKYILTLSLIFTFQFSFSQTFRKTNGSVPLHHTINLAEISTPDFSPNIIYIDQHPVPAGEFSNKKEMLHIQRELKYHELKNSIEKKQRGTAVNPIIEKSWAGNTNNGTPLDNDIAVSNDGIIISAVNSNIRCFDDTGKFIYNRALNSLAGLGGFAYTSDPRVLYDPNSDKFILVFFTGNTSSTSLIYVGFSQTNQPNGLWNFYSLNGNSFNDSTWSDYPIISMNNNDLFMTFNQVKDNIGWQFGFKQSVIWQIDKASGFGGGPLQYTLWDSLMNNNGLNYRNICPAKKQITNMGNDMYFVSVRNVDVSNDSVFMFHIDNTQQSGLAQISTKVAKSNINYGMPPNAKQAAGQYLMTNDGRILAAVEEFDRIYFGTNSVNPAFANAGVYLGEIKNISTIPTVTANLFSEINKEYGYPSMTFVGGGANEHRILYHFLHCYRDSFSGTSIMYKNDAGDFSDIISVKDGVTVTNSLVDSNERWGDYTNIQKMYNNPSISFMAGSYGTNNGCRTWIGKIFNTEFPADIPLNEKTKSASIIYPNPVPEAFFNTIFDLTETQNVRCSILDVNGKLIQHLLEKNCTKGKNQFSFNINPLSTGNYILTVKGDKGFLYSEKLIKE
jgi:hypothetical protein